MTGDHRCRPAQGVAHRGRDRAATRTSSARMKVRATRRPGRPAVGVGRAVRGADVGDRVRGRARLSARPAARRCRRGRRRCAGHAGVAGPGAGAGPVEQERPERRAVGRGRCACARRRCDRSRRPTTARCCGCWRSATSTSATTAPGSCAASTRCWWSSPRAGSPRNSTLLTSTRFLAAVDADHAGRAGPLRPGRRAPRRHPPPRRPAQGVTQADPRPRSRASGTTLTDLFGVGPIIAAMLIGYTGDVTRFREPRPLRRLQRHRPGRVLLRRPNRAPAVPARATAS